MKLWIFSFTVGLLLVVGFFTSMFVYPAYVLLGVGLLFVGMVVVGVSLGIHDIVEEWRKR